MDGTALEVISRLDDGNDLQIIDIASCGLSRSERREFAGIRADSGSLPEKAEPHENEGSRC